MQAGVSNQVARVLGIYERKRTGLLLEIDEKPELPNNVRLQNSPYFCVFKYARAVKQKVWKEAENRERDLGRDALRACGASRAKDTYGTLYRFLY